MALDAVGLEQAIIQKPSSPTSWIATTLTGAAMRCSARVFNRARRSSSLRPSPPTSVCLDILLLPGASAVATHVERLSSNETNKVAQSPRCRSALKQEECSVMHWSLPRSVVGDVDLPEFAAPPASLYTVESFDPDHDAVMRIGGEAPGGGPILSVGIECHVRIRLPATSDRQFGSRAEKSARAEWC